MIPCAPKDFFNGGGSSAGTFDLIHYMKGKFRAAKDDGKQLPSKLPASFR